MLACAIIQFGDAHLEEKATEPVQQEAGVVHRAVRKAKSFVSLFSLMSASRQLSVVWPAVTYVL